MRETRVRPCLLCGVGMLPEAMKTFPGTDRILREAEGRTWEGLQVGLLGRQWPSH